MRYKKTSIFYYVFFQYRIYNKAGKDTSRFRVWLKTIPLEIRSDGFDI